MGQVEVGTVGPRIKKRGEMMISFDDYEIGKLTKLFLKPGQPGLDTKNSINPPAVGDARSS